MAVVTTPLGARRGFPNPFRGVGETRRQRTIIAVLLALAIAYPFFYQAIPDFLPRPSVNNLIVMVYYAMLALGLNIVVGFAGLLDLGYVAFYVFGAYSTAFLASPIFGLHISWWLVIVVAVAVAATAGIVGVLLAGLLIIDVGYFTYNRQHLDFVFFEYLDELVQGGGDTGTSQAAQQ
ncbi:MAG: hypothetical protein C4343_04720, partial [Chloroflexota bacterium]